MQRDIAAAGVEHHGAILAVADAAIAAARLEIDAVLRNGRGNAIVAAADNPADRLRSVAQGAWAANDLHLPRHQRVNRHRMIFAKVGHVMRADPVFLGSDAKATQATNDRSAGDGRERRGGYTRRRRQ